MNRGRKGEMATPYNVGNSKDREKIKKKGINVLFKGCCNVVRED